MQNEISDYLVNLLENLEDDDGHPALGQVVDYEPAQLKFEASPYAFVTPSRQPGEYDTTSANNRREGFSIYIGIPLEAEESEDETDPNQGRQELFSNMRTLTDLVRNAIDKTEDLNGLTGDAGRSTVYSVVPATSGWSLPQTDAGVTLLSEIEIIVKYSYEFR